MLVFQTKMDLMPGKLRFWWTGPFWIINNKNGTYQVRKLAREILPKWMNGFRLKPYQGPMPENQFSVEVDHVVTWQGDKSVKENKKIDLGKYITEKIPVMMIS